jgi:hypothetical protein
MFSQEDGLLICFAFGADRIETLKLKVRALFSTTVLPDLLLSQKKLKFSRNLVSLVTGGITMRLNQSH